jgi:hypothetical protein
LKTQEEIVLLVSKKMEEHDLPLMRKTIKEVVMGPHT